MTGTRLLLAAVLPLACAACTYPVREMPPDHAVAGAFGNDGRSWKVRDAAAVSGPEGTVLVVTRLYFDRRAWARDARLDYDDLARFLDNDHDYAPELDVKLDAAEPRPAEHSELNVLEWKVALDPGAKRRLRFDFSVEHPRSMDVIGLL